MTQRAQSWAAKLVGLLVLALPSGCVGDSHPVEDGDAVDVPDSAWDAEASPTFVGIMVVGTQSFCDGRMQTTPGADIDAVELLDGSGASISFGQAVVGEPSLPDACASNKFRQLNHVLGPPDGSWVSLGDGWITIGFGVQLTRRHVLKFSERGSGDCPTCLDDEFVVFLVTDLDCQPGAPCATLLSTTAVGDARIPLYAN